MSNYQDLGAKSLVTFQAILHWLFILLCCQFSKAFLEEALALSVPGLWQDMHQRKIVEHCFLLCGPKLTLMRTLARHFDVLVHPGLMCWMVEDKVCAAFLSKFLGASHYWRLLLFCSRRDCHISAGIRITTNYNQWVFFVKVCTFIPRAFGRTLDAHFSLEM